MKYKYDLDKYSVDDRDDVESYNKFFDGVNKITPPKSLDTISNRVNPTCDSCGWTNIGCLNFGVTNETPYWLCQGCIKKIIDNYNELIYAVSRKFKDETRHQTALRYITEVEKNNHHPVKQK